MKTLPISKTIVLIAACGMGFISAAASAGPDSAQQWLTQQALKAAQEAKKAEAVQLAECKRLIEKNQEHK